MRRIALIYALLAVYFGSERLLRQGEAATSLTESETDQGSTRTIGKALGVSMIALALAPLLNRVRFSVLPNVRIPSGTGVAAIAGGLLIRIWATRALGGAYTRTLRVAADQHIVEDGPYRVIRHPGYLGTLLVWLGAALATANWLIMALVGASLLRAYGKRIQAEEQMLLDTFGDDYRAYAARTRRLVPLLY